MIASLGGVSALMGAALLRFAASRAFAICSLRAFEELAAFFGVPSGDSVTSCFRAALAWAMVLRSASDELDTLRTLPGVGDSARAVPGGDIAWPYDSASEDRHGAIGVREVVFLLAESGAGLDRVRVLWIGVKAGFLMAVVGRDRDEMRLGVVVGVEKLALALLLPGTVMEMREDGALGLLGVTGRRLAVPSLVVGLLPLLLLDIADAERRGGAMLLSWLKKLDLRPLLLLFAGEEGSWARLSTVLSDSDGRGFLLAAWAESTFASTSGTCSGDELVSWKPAREPALEDAPEAARKPSRLPSASSSPLVIGVRSCWEGVLVWREGGRAKGFLKAGAC